MVPICYPLKVEEKRTLRKPAKTVVGRCEGMDRAELEREV